MTYYILRFCILIPSDNQYRVLFSAHHIRGQEGPMSAFRKRRRPFGFGVLLLRLFVFIYKHRKIMYYLIPVCSFPGYLNIICT